jgi:pimeloyl-ACP methyl ester carboxylesterase
VIVAETVREQTRARYPDEEGYVERDGVQIFWERYGQGEPTVLLMPTWEIVHPRFWKCQIPYLARHGRVVTFDPPGNGRSDRPTQYDAYTPKAFAEDAVAVLEAADVECPVVVGWCDLGESLIFAAEHPERVAGLVLIGTPVPDGPGPVEYEEYPFEDELDTDEGWAKENRHYWLRNWRGYLEWFFSQCFTEPHSTKQVEDCIGWGLETDAETILAGFRGWDTKAIDDTTMIELCERISCPALVIHGTADALCKTGRGRALAEALGSRLVLLESSGHGPHVRDPVRVNLLIHEFVESLS